jgi:hypothetical protein
LVASRNVPSMPLLGPSSNRYLSYQKDMSGGFRWRPCRRYVPRAG